MANASDAEQAIIDQVVVLAPKASAEQLKNLAEAFAWAHYGNQPH
jgi:hypothetical protein